MGTLALNKHAIALEFLEELGSLGNRIYLLFLFSVVMRIIFDMLSSLQALSMMLQ